MTNNVVGVVFAVAVAVAAVVVIDIVVVAVGVVVVPVVDNPFCGLFRLRRLGRFNVGVVVDNVVTVVVDVFVVFGSVVMTSIISMVVAVGEVNWVVFKGAGDVVNVEEDWVFVADAVSVTAAVVVGIGL